MTTLNENFVKNLDIMRKNIHRGMTEAQANEVIDRMEAQLKGAMQYTTEAREYIRQMRQVVADGFGGTISAADAMRQLGVHLVHIK
jgi:hypothetical protein